MVTWLHGYTVKLLSEGNSYMGMRGRSGKLRGVICALAAGTLIAGGANPPKQRTLDEWRAITRPDAPPPRVFVKGDNIRLYFRSETNIVEFSAHRSRLRVPTEGYRVSSALLHWE